MCCVACSLPSSPPNSLPSFVTHSVTLPAGSRRRRAAVRGTACAAARVWASGTCRSGTRTASRSSPTLKPRHDAHSPQVGEAAVQQTQVPAQRHEPLQLRRRLEEAGAHRLGGHRLRLSSGRRAHLHRPQQALQIRAAAGSAVALHHAGQVAHVHRQLHQHPHGRAQADAVGHRLRVLSILSILSILSALSALPVVVTDVTFQQDACCG